MRGAAAVDPEIAALRSRMHEFRYENMRRFVSWLAAKGSLRGGMTAGDAAAIVWTLAGPEAHGLLRRDRGWAQERYVAWLADTLSRTLLHASKAPMFVLCPGEVETTEIVPCGA